MNQLLPTPLAERFYASYIQVKLLHDFLGHFSAVELEEANQLMSKVLDITVIQSLLDACPDNEMRLKTFQILSKANFSDDTWLTTLPLTQEELALIFSEAIERSILACQVLVTPPQLDSEPDSPLR
jgi:hypothetical protein